jgi:hypothetical protein
MDQNHCAVCGYAYSKAQHIGCPNCAAARVEHVAEVPRRAPKAHRTSPLLDELALAVQRPAKTPEE